MEQKFIIVANERTLFLAACDLNNQIREKRYFKHNLVINGNVEFFAPNKSGEMWRVIQECTYENDNNVPAIILRSYSFIWASGHTEDECMKEYEKELAKKMEVVRDIRLEGKVILFPAGIVPGIDWPIWQAYHQYSYKPE